MARPKTDDPRGAVIRVRVTDAEKARIGELAKAAAVNVSDYVRGRALVVEARSPRVEVPKLFERAEPRKLTRPGRWCCPEPGCLENGESKEERCQKHGTLMLSRG